jgi:arginine decarboxylase
MATEGHEILSQALLLVEQARSRLAALPGLHLMESEFIGPTAGDELDPFHIVLDLTDLGISGYQAADWLREQTLIDGGLSDHRRTEITLSQADDQASVDRAVDAFQALLAAAPGMPKPKPIDLPDPKELELETAELPRKAFFAPTEEVSARHAVGRIAAEQLTPYPPGIPVVVPGEVLNAAVIDYLRSGLAAGMVVPDAADPKLKHIRVSTS